MRSTLHWVLLLSLATPELASARNNPQPRLVQLQNGKGWRVLRPALSWGTPLLVGRLGRVLADVHRRFPRAPVIWVHDISRRRGGPLRWHTSHREGRDVDIRLPQRFLAGYVDATPRILDIERTWYLIVALVATCDVEFIMLDHGLQRLLYRHARRRGVPRDALALVLQYPRRLWYRHPDSSVVRHYPRHRNHMHVRFRREDKLLSSTSTRMLCAARRRSHPLIRHVYKTTVTRAPLQQSQDL